MKFEITPSDMDGWRREMNVKSSATKVQSCMHNIPTSKLAVSMLCQYNIIFYFQDKNQFLR